MVSVDPPIHFAPVDSWGCALAGVSWFLIDCEWRLSRGRERLCEGFFLPAGEGERQMKALTRQLVYLWPSGMHKGPWQVSYPCQGPKHPSVAKLGGAMHLFFD
jgi:hypothetical protein